MYVQQSLIKFKVYDHQIINKYLGNTALTMMKAKRFISLEYIIDVKNYKESFQKWMKIRDKFATTNQEIRNLLFNQYLRVIKPIIHRFDQGISLVSVVVQKYPSSLYGFYSSNLSSSQILILKEIFTPLQNFDIVTEQPAQLIENQQIQSGLSTNFKPIYRLDLETKPTNSELKWWGHTIKVQPVSIEGIVVAGKGEGRKNLGMPTANLQLTFQLQKKLDSYPNGVYLVDFDFVNGQSYKGAGCLGTNPHYQNFQESRRIEVYVLHNFDDQLFYGSRVNITLKQLIRFQGKFHNFDAFLNAMHNDIQIAETLSNINAKN